MKVDTTELLVKAACSIHNWLRMTSAKQYFPSGCVDEEDVNNVGVNPGAWRTELINPLLSVDRTCAGCLSNNCTIAAEKCRREYAAAFSTNLSVPWQLKRLYLICSREDIKQTIPFSPRTR